MIPFHRLYFGNRAFGFKHKHLYLLSIMLFFYSIFDGMVSYVFPLAIEEQQFSKTMMGIIIGSSSIVGATFDFFISKYIRNTHYRRMYLLMFSICFLFPIVLWSAKPIWLFLLASGLWGNYYDLYNFGNYDFISRKTPPEEHSSSFGKLWIFGALGRMIAPIFAGLVIGEVVGWKPYAFMYAALIVSSLFFLVLLVITRKKERQDLAIETHKPRNFIRELHLWSKIGKLIFPILLLTMLLNIMDAFFWTIGPLLSESYKNLHPFNGFFLTMYELPVLLLGWFVGSITAKFGKKRTGFVFFILGSLLLSAFPFVSQAIFILIIIFFASSCMAIAWPSIKGTYADYIGESRAYESEIEALEDFFTNLGYIFGPILSGVLADMLGNEKAFVVLGISSAIFALILWSKTPKKITIKVS